MRARLIAVVEITVVVFLSIYVVHKEGRTKQKTKFLWPAKFHFFRVGFYTLASAPAPR